MDGSTIFALASAPGRAGIAVFRLSGPAAENTLRCLAGKCPPPRQAGRVRLAWAGEQIDDGLALWFPAPASFTGEDVVELHVHGGRAVAQALTDALTAQGLRPAEPGEFSKRAFHNGKLDLTRAEAIADLVDAETAAQRRQALRQLDGAVAKLVDGWRARLIHALALQEAAIDFSDDGVGDDAVAEAGRVVAALAADLRASLQESQVRERLRHGIHIAILGAPNAGKSSLLNRIAGRDVAIVSAHAGTTRDIIEIHLDLNGWPVILADTAGLRDEAGEIEAEGIGRALARAEQADLKMLVFDATLLPHRDSATQALADDNSIIVFNKCDVFADEGGSVPIDTADALMVSARTGDGIGELLAGLGQVVSTRFAVSADPALNRVRHRLAVEQALAALDRFAVADGIELAAEEIRRAAAALGRITGRVDVEEVLDVVFSQFCIGK